MSLPQGPNKYNDARVPRCIGIDAASTRRISSSCRANGNPSSSAPDRPDAGDRLAMRHFGGRKIRSKDVSYEDYAREFVSLGGVLLE